MADVDRAEQQVPKVDDGEQAVVKSTDADDEQVLIMESKPLDWVHGKLLDEMYKGG